MTIIKINALEVPAERGDMLAERFSARADAMKDVPGCQGFELLRPTDDRSTWLVVTRWDDEAAFEAWKESETFKEGHQSRPGGPAATGATLWSYTVAVKSS